MNEISPGWKTSEYWLTVAAMVVGALMASGAFMADSTVGQVVGFIGMVLAKLGYTASRGFVKANPPAPELPPAPPPEQLK